MTTVSKTIFFPAVGAPNTASYSLDRSSGLAAALHAPAWAEHSPCVWARDTFDLERRARLQPYGQVLNADDVEHHKLEEIHAMLNTVLPKLVRLDCGLHSDASKLERAVAGT